MSTTAKERAEVYERLARLGITGGDAVHLRRISMTLHRWHELECGDGSGCIERDEKTGQAYWYSANARYVDPNDPRARRSIPDRERGALRRLEKVMKRYPTLSTYIQTDPRGAALYLLRPGDVPAGGSPESYYSRGVCIY
jgi:hypothetical protein